MRNALILLAVVAVVIIVAGALNGSVAFDVDYVAGTLTEVSLVWIAVVVAAIVVVAGACATWLAQRTSRATRRKLEAELQSTYERLREAEALVPAPVVAPAPGTPETDAAAEAPQEATTVTAVVAADAKASGPADDAPVTADEAAAADDGSSAPVPDGDAGDETERTAVTAVIAPAADESAADAGDAAQTD